MTAPRPAKSVRHLDYRLGIKQFAECSKPMKEEIRMMEVYRNGRVVPVEVYDNWRVVDTRKKKHDSKSLPTGWF